MVKKRHICFFTGKRGGFTHLIPIIEKLSQTEEMEYSIIAADMHLSRTFGKTIREVRNWVDNVYNVETLLETGSKVARAKSIGLAVISFSQLLDTIRPSFVFVVGDRGEVLAMAIAALELNIPIIHLFGGDVCQGGVDEPIRHAITKLANIHLTSNHESARRIIRMGEEAWRVYTVGSPVLDLIRQNRFTPADEVVRKFNLQPDKPIILLLQHSVTWQVESVEAQIRETMAAIDEVKYQTVAIYPCADPGYEEILAVFAEYRDRPYFQAHANIEFGDFWGLLDVAAVFMGNSSAGVMETPSFKKPFINIGIRQKGRLRANNVIDVAHARESIIGAVKTALEDAQFQAQLRRCESPYGDGHASKKIVSILAGLKADTAMIRKEMTF